VADVRIDHVWGAWSNRPRTDCADHRRFVGRGRWRLPPAPPATVLSPTARIACLEEPAGDITAGKGSRPGTAKSTLDR
jgi:hypothetical protein